MKKQEKYYSLVETGALLPIVNKVDSLEKLYSLLQKEQESLHLKAVKMKDQGR